MRAGLLNERVEIQHKEPVQDASGATVHEWRQFACVWADVRHVSGSESVRSDAVVPAVRASIRIRYRDGIHSGMRVLVRGQVYQVLAVLPDFAGLVFTDLVCEKSEGGDAESERGFRGSIRPDSGYER